MPKGLHGDGADVIPGKIPTPADDVTHAAAVAAVRDAVPTLNGFLDKMLTLNTALVGGGLAFWKGDVLPFWWGVGVLTAALLSLCAALYGLMPTKGFVDPYAVGGTAAYRVFEARVLRKKERTAYAAAALLAAALLIGVAGLARQGPPKSKTGSVGGDAPAKPEPPRPNATPGVADPTQPAAPPTPLPPPAMPIEPPFLVPPDIRFAPVPLPKSPPTKL